MLSLNLRMVIEMGNWCRLQFRDDSMVYCYRNTRSGRWIVRGQVGGLYYA